MKIAIRDAAIASKDAYVWFNAIYGMINNDYIRDVAIASNNEKVYLAAINEMINDEYIRDVAIASNNEQVCYVAINEMINDEYLGEVRQKLNSLIVERERLKTAMERMNIEMNSIFNEFKKTIEKEEIERPEQKKVEQEKKEKERAKIFASYEKKSLQPTIIRENPCDRCMCKTRAFPLLPNYDRVYEKVNINCLVIQKARTAHADYYWCYKGGPPNDGSPDNWYAGRGC
jgi:hypothetical protein